MDDIAAWPGSRPISNGSSNGGLSGSDDGQTVLEAIPVVTGGLDGGWFGKIGLSAILILGTFGNVMTIVILRTLRSGWSAMNVYLTALALSDTAMLYSGALPMWTRKVFHFDLYAYNLITCKGGIWVMNSSASLSAWLLVTLTAQRAASVVWPHRVNLLCTQHKSVVIICVITVICGGLYSHTLFGYELVRVGNETSLRCTFGEGSYQDFWVTVWVWVDMLIYSLLPCTCLVLGNAVLGWKLAVAFREASSKLSAVGNEDGRRKRTSSTTVTIICVSTAFILITLPLMTYNSFFQDYASSDSAARDFHYFLYDFFFVFGLSNFAWNFYLYCLTGTKFRRQFVNILCARCVHSSPMTSTKSTVYVTEEGQRQSGPGSKMPDLDDRKKMNEAWALNDDF